jgi:hypothetical protein
MPSAGCGFSVLQIAQPLTWSSSQPPASAPNTAPGAAITKTAAATEIVRLEVMAASSVF